MKRKIVAFSLILCMALVAIAGMSLAYFTDEKEAENVFTVGSVKIELYESTLHREDWGKGTIYSDEEIIADAADYQDYLAAPEQQLMPGIAINKMPYVKNVGKSDAYVRIRVMIPTALDLAVLNSSMYCSSALEEEFTIDVDWVDPETVTVGGIEYDVYEFVRTDALKPGEMTYWNVWNTIMMDTDVTQSEVEAFIAAGAITNNGQFNVLVQADAIQKASFNSAAEAFAAFDAEN